MKLGCFKLILEITIDSRQAKFSNQIVKTNNQKISVNMYM